MVEVEAEKDRSAWRLLIKEYASLCVKMKKNGQKQILHMIFK